MLVTTLIVFLVLDAAWILYAMKTAPIVEDEEPTLSEPNKLNSFKILILFSLKFFSLKLLAQGLDIIY